MTHKKVHVIIQAGGRGSRLRHHTWNKPKCLVSVRGKPILYHLFDQFTDATFTIIGDYAFEQLEKYLDLNPPHIKYTLLHTTERGTAAGIAEVATALPAHQPVMLVWSDLIIHEPLQFPETESPVIYITSAFTCRWTISENGTLQESPAAERGIPGLFYFPRADILQHLPKGGEFVRWFSGNIHDFHTQPFEALEELGDFSTIEETNNAMGFSRFFNQVTLREKTVEKLAIDPQYQHLIEKEQAWYTEASQLGFHRIPKVLSTNPFVMERIYGQHLYHITDLSKREQRAVFANYLDSLSALHQKSHTPVVEEDVLDVYLHKTLARVRGVSSIIPGFQRDAVVVNGKKCRNVFSEKHATIIDTIVPRLLPEHFSPIHGDPTFSNSLIDDRLRVWFIDPRGYFSKPGVMGDPWYDFAKVYYSAVGGYDTFNRRKFKLHVDEETVEILFEEPRYADTAREVFAEYFGAEMARIEMLHGLIWLSLSGYARDDIDSIIGAFYLGLYWLERGISR